MALTHIIDTDPFFGELLICCDDEQLNKNWFKFGYQLGLTSVELYKIKPNYDEALRYIGVIEYWRFNNPTESWQPIADALVKIGLSDLAQKVHDHFTPPSASAVNSINDVPSKY